ncbi:hypothetical protein Rhopal_005577-T1 [Rhodotorula paludigena]|uniref:C2 DOCK-type domain-containing protein n=1 Tax=Rhodotorula paludigena TaxID=86838 RepID=A0AAV5GT55_9BASI|nr:hypothetical protein Rhopal_005577-T1 [Rhodotorula paludigena]
MAFIFNALRGAFGWRGALGSFREALVTPSYWDSRRSADVTDTAFRQILDCQLARAFCKQWQDLHDSCYGQHCGGVFENIPLLAKLFPKHPRFLLIRDVYTEMYRWIKHRLATTVDEGTCLFAYGSPGIGKSSFLPYLVIRCLEERRPVAFHVIGASEVVLFLDLGAFVIPAALLASLEFTRPLVLALDSASDPSISPIPELIDTPRAVTVVAASPRATRRQPFDKGISPVYYWTMPPPGSQEIENVCLLRRNAVAIKERAFPQTLESIEPESGISGGAAFSSGQFLRPFDVEDDTEAPPGSKDFLFGSKAFRLSDLPQYSSSELSGLLPPSFRAAAPAVLPKKTSDMVSNLLSGLTTTTFSLRQLTGLGRGAASPDTAQSTGYHQIFTIVAVDEHDQPTPASPECTVVAATSFVLEFLRLSYRELQLNDQVAMASRLRHEPQMRGIVYEALAFRRLGDAVELSLSLFESGRVVKIPANLPHGEWDPDGPAPFPHVDGVYTFPPRFPAADGLVSLPDMYIIVQATILNRHSIKKDGIRRICRSYPPNAPPLVFAFLAPDEDTAKALVTPARPSLDKVPAATSVGSRETEGAQKKHVRTVTISAMHRLDPNQSDSTPEVSAEARLHTALPAPPALVDGDWQPSSSIAYGIACATFAPVVVENSGDASRDELNPHQVPLEVGDEVYVVEVFRPSHPVASSSSSTSEAGVWYRGYVVSTAPHPTLPSAADVYAFPSSAYVSPTLAQEPQVSLGIFPASHVQVREHLSEDAEHKLADLSAQVELDAAGGSSMSRSGSRGGASSRAGRMAPLREEEEPEEDDAVNVDGSARRRSRLIQLAPPTSPSKGARNRSSVGSMASFAQQLSSEQKIALQSSRLANGGGFHTRPNPPLPNLKCGDETLAGADEPLIDEIACALREWASLLYTHLYRRDYDLFDAVKRDIDILHGARKQLLTKTLSVDESARLRRDIVARLVKGNVQQGLDVIVRHPASGGLVDVNVVGELDRHSWMSVVRMYAAQVALAYGAPLPDSSSLVSKDASTVQAPASAATATLREPFSTSGLDSSSPAQSTSPAAKFHHVLVDFRNLAAQIAAPGEIVELYFSLFADSRYITEEFCVLQTATSQGGFTSRDNPLRTLFRDLSQHDVSDQLYLVCRIVRNGPYKGSAGSGGSPQLSQKAGFRAESPSLQSVTSRAMTSDSEPSGMLITDASGRQSCRRPFGCAVLELSRLNRRGSVSDSSAFSDSLDTLPEQQMPIFVPVNEAAISTLHESIIMSRLKDIDKNPRAEHISVGVRILHGEINELAHRMPNLLDDVPDTNRLGFPDVVFPGQHRNEVYLKLWSGEFGSGASSSNGAGGTSTVRSLAQLASAGGSAGSFEVTAEVRTRDGTVVDKVLSRGYGEPSVSQFTSMVFRSSNSPTWGELVKLDIPVEQMEECHVFLTIRNRAARTSPEQPFAFAFFPLFPHSTAFQTDGSHTLALYRCDKTVAVPSSYLQAPSTYDASHQLAPVPPAVSRTLVPLKDTIVVRSFLVSTTYTQNETLLRLLRWEQELLPDPELMRDTLTKLRFCSEVEVCKFLRDIFDALFAILVSPANQLGDLDDLIFEGLVHIFGFVSDRRFSFKPVLDLYISQHFTSSAAASHIIQALQRLLRTPANSEAATALRSSIKVWKWLLKLVVRSREIQRAKEPGSGATSSHLEASFKAEIASLLSQINALMRATTPSSVIGTQTLVVQHFPTILPELSTIFDIEALLEIAMAFVDAIPTSKGKMVIWKTLLLNSLVRSALFASPTGRGALVPALVRWLKPSLGKFDEYAMCSPKDPQATRDNIRVSWIEGIRLSTGVVAAMLDVVQEALVDPEIINDRALLLQEEDNLEYLLSLVPRLLESYRELENLANLDAIERQRSSASIPTTSPTVFPASYPISLLSYSPEYARKHASSAAPRQEKGEDETTWPTLRTGVGEIACVFIAMIQLAPRKILVNWLESTAEVEGKETFARQLGAVFRIARSILENEAFPAEWLNITALAHRVILKLVEPVADVLVRDFIPPPAASFKFNTALWRDFFTMLLKVLASPQLLIEEFSPQKRRALWRLAGDIRGVGARVLMRTWRAIAWPSERKQKHGLYQVQFVPGLVEDVLSLCLSHHDELRRCAVSILHSMIMSEYDLNKHFAILEAECVDRLDKLFGHQTKGDELSRGFFVAQLKQLFDESDIDNDLRNQVDAFLSSINSFLDLLLAVRNLPEGEEYQEDRIISTLKLMSFIRGIGRSEIFVRYVQRLVTYHVALGNFVEAGLTLKLHADLHDWNLTAFVDALPELDLPRQTEFARKETLYMRILEYLSKGKAYETALDLCKELEAEFEAVYNYPRLAELLNLKSELYAYIAKSDRHFGNYFRVAFYGSRWPLSVSGKQFIYRGQELESLGAFVERMLNKHPNAQLLRSSSIPDEDVQYGENQFLQITAVAPEVDHSSPILTNPDVPHYVRSYWQHCEVNTFSFSRPLTKDVTGRSRSISDFASLWSEKTVLICEDSFPTVLRRSEIVEIRLIEISPVENACKDVETKKSELATLERRYRALLATEGENRKINSNPLSMALNGAVDAPLNQGIPMYRRAFLQPEFIATLPPSQVAVVRQLETSIDELVVTLARCLKLHAVICPPEMHPFHETLERFFEKNFASELARLPDQGSYEPASFTPPAASAEPVMTGPRVYGSLLIGSPSTTSLTAINGPTSTIRRESVSTLAMNDKVLLSRAAQAVPSGMQSTAPPAVGRAGSISSFNDAGASPSKSIFSTRNGSISSGTNGHSNGADGTNSATGRRSSLLSSAVKKFGRKKGSGVESVMEE